jgi:aryl-alcohol dehydrogenase
MKIRAAIAWEAGAPLSIEEVELDEPRADEILVRVEAVGVCHTDDKARHAKLPVLVRHALAGDRAQHRPRPR